MGGESCLYSQLEMKYLGPNPWPYDVTALRLQDLTTSRCGRYCDIARRWRLGVPESGAMAGGWPKISSAVFYVAGHQFANREVANWRRDLRHFVTCDVSNAAVCLVYGLKCERQEWVISRGVGRRVWGGPDWNE